MPKKKCSVHIFLLLITNILGSVIVPANAATGPPGTYVEIFWKREENYNFDIDIEITDSPENDAQVLFWAHQFGFIDGSGGYIGLQVVGSQKKAIFSIWGAITGEPGHMIDEYGSVWSIVVDYNWKLGQKYRLRIWELEVEPSGDEWWLGSVYDYTTGTDFIIGKILVPASWGWLTSYSITWTEYAGYDYYDSSDIPYTRAVFSGHYARHTIENSGPDNLHASYGSLPSSNSDVDYYGGTTYALEAGDNVVRDTPEGWLVVPESSFSVSVSPSSRSVVRGNTVDYTVSVSWGSGSGTISLSLSGLPSNVGIGDFSIDSSSSNSWTSTLTIGTFQASPTGSYSLTVTGTSGGIVNSASCSLIIDAPPNDYLLSASPDIRSVTAGGNSTSYTVTATLQSGSPSISLSLDNPPAWLTWSFSHSSGSPTFSSMLTVSASPSAPTGSHTLYVKGSGGGMPDHMIAVTLTVNTPPTNQRSLTVSSLHGSPTPSVGSHSYSSGSSVTASVNSPVIEGITIWICTGWSGTGSVPSSGSGTSTTFMITQDSSITWHWLARVTSDLIISNISWEPSSPTVGDSVIFSYSIENQGDVDVDAFTTALYIDGERIDISARRPLSAGAIESRSFTYAWIATEGSHTVEVVADDLNEIAESNENNNKMGKTLDVQLMDVNAEIMPVIITTRPDLSPKKFYLYLTNKGSENMEQVSIELRTINGNIHLLKGREHVEYGEIPATESSVGGTYFEISEISDISDLILEADIEWSDYEGYHEETIEFEVPNPSTDLTQDWSSLIWKILSSQIISILAKIVAVPTIPLSWLITEFTGGLYRDSFIVFVTDENGSPLENVEVRTSLFEYWPWILVPPEHSILAKNGIVHWTDAENSLAEVKVINWDSHQSIYINPEAYDNLRTPEIPIISIVFHSDGKISWLAPPLIDVKLSNDVNTLQIKGESPINILLTDPQGNRVGYDFVSKQSVAEVPFAVYSGPGMEPQLITIQNPSKGKYKIEVFGTDEGPYKVTTSFIDPQGITISEREYEGETDEGTEQEIIVELSQDDKLQAPGSSLPGYIQYWFLFPIIVSIAILVAIYLIRRKKLQRK